MEIQRVSTVSKPVESPNFKAFYVTLSEKNLGKQIATNVVGTFNSKILPELRKTQEAEATAIIARANKETLARDGFIGGIVTKAQDLIEKVDVFGLGAGSGSRFKELAQTVGDYNKISLPFRFGKDKNIHMLDFALAMNKFFIGKEGVNKIIASQPSGSFGDIVQHYLAGNPIKDIIVCCGDNVFGDKASDIMTFFTKTINNPNKHLGLVGVARTPEEVANRFGVLEVAQPRGENEFQLSGFSEKPPIEEAKKIAVDGKNIANTGLFYISKEAMGNLINEIKSGVNNIKKNDTEIYDFANAVKYVHSKMNDWFKILPERGADVKVVNKWEDVGEPQALYSFATEVKNGEFLANFPKEMANEIQTSFNKRVRLEENMPYINFSEVEEISADKIINAKDIEGVKIIV